MPDPNPLPDLSAAAVAPLEQIGDYQLLAKLGAGGMGQVYRALHVQLGRVVAVKILPQDLSENEDAVRRFKTEKAAAGRLKHPHIVYAEDAREIDGKHLLIMEYLEGMDLAHLVRKVPALPVADACEMIRQAALGLQYAHEKKLVHRDVKPSNLMLAWDGEGREPVEPPMQPPGDGVHSPAATVKLLDLGLARLPADSVTRESLTLSGMIMGTPDFIAPEQIRGSHHVDIRADIYSLGCTFYFLLAGQPPFAGPDHATLYDKLKAHEQQQPLDIRKLRRDVPPGLGKIVRKMMAKQPQDRFAAPGEVAAAVTPFTSGCDLTRLLAGTQGTSLAGDANAAERAAALPTLDGDTHGAADPTRQTQPRQAGARPAKLWWGIAALGLAVLAAGAAWIMISRSGDVGEDTDAAAAQQPADVSMDSQAGSSDAPADAPSENIQHDDGSPAAGSGDAPHRQSPSDGAGSEQGSDWIALSWASPDENRPSIWIFRPDGSRQLRVTRDPGMLDSEPAFAPNGRRLAFTRGDQNLKRSGIWVCDVAGSRLREIAAATGPTERLMSPVWLTNQRLIYTRDPEFDASNDVELWQADVPDHLGVDEALPPPTRVFSFQHGFGDRGGLITDTNPAGDRFVGLIQPAGQRSAADIFVSDCHGKAWETIWSDEIEERRDTRALWSPDGRWIAWQHQFTPGTQFRGIRVGIGLAKMDEDGQWNTDVQPDTAALALPVAWSPGEPGLLFTRIIGGPGRLPHAAFFLMNPDTRASRPQFDLPGGRTIVLQRHGGRLGDWAFVPGNVPLPPAGPRPL